MNALVIQSGRIRAVRLAGAALASVALALTVLLAPATAWAGGNFSIKTPEVQENAGEWHVKVRIDLARAPNMMHTPMRFTFSKEVVDERAIMSKGAEPVHHRNVLDVAPKQIVSMDVDFADASGKVFKSTYFEFDLARKDGYFEAGEYQVSLDGPDGTVGGTQKLVLKGDNPPVYRGAMDFSDDSKSQKKKGPKMESVSNGLDGGSQVAQNDDGAGSSGGSNAAIPSGEVAAEGEGGDMVPKSAFNKTSEEEAVQDHPKGCGCVAAGLGGGSLPEEGAALGLGLAAAGLVLARRRRANGTRA